MHTITHTDLVEDYMEELRDLIHHAKIDGDEQFLPDSIEDLDQEFVRKSINLHYGLGHSHSELLYGHIFNKRGE